jgi:hypothetical protein
MKTYSTRQAAKMLSISNVALAHYIKVKKVPAPQIMNVGGRDIHVWSEAEIEHVRKLLPKIANGRKTRYKKQSAVSTQQSAISKNQRAQARRLRSKKKK